MKIAFENLGTAKWTAGSIYLTNLLLAVRQAMPAGRDVRVAVVTGPGAVVSDEVRAAVDEVVELTEAVPPSTVRRLIRGVRRRMGRPVETAGPLGAALVAADVDVFFASSTAGYVLPVPVMGWIPDFQHRRLPSMFSAEENAIRDREYWEIATRAKTVVLSSGDSQRDFVAFAPAQAAKAAILRFVTPIPPAVFSTDPVRVIDRYHLPKKFFYLPNQLWRHKNIEVVIDAVALLRQRDLQVSIVWTGNASDYRHPEYGATVLRRIAESDVREPFVMLGLVPRQDVFALARQAVAVIQPSHFEGWSTSVEECKSLGKRMVLSDLPVHREQAPPQSSYFDPNSAEDLATKLEAVWRSTDPGPASDMEAAARTSFTNRFTAFGQAFLNIADRAVE